jgi:hypothetical protein
VGRRQSFQNVELRLAKATAIGKIVSVAVGLTMASAACSAPISSNKTKSAFLCSVKGVQHLGAGTTDAAVCDMFKTRIEKALAAKMKVAKSASGVVEGDWIKVDVRLVKSGTATAILTQKIGSKQKAYPAIAVDVMDKPLGQKEVEMLAREVARQISGPARV